MDFQNRPGSKPGSGGVAGSSESNVDRRERLRKLALETIDLTKDPYFMKNHLGSYECKLCLTLHSNEGSYLAHTQGKKHQTNLARRAAKDQYISEVNRFGVGQLAQQIIPKKNFIKIGRPGYKVAKIKDPATKNLGLLFQISYPEIAYNVIPRHRFMSAFEQTVEVPNKLYQYLIIAAEPYETISFKVQSRQLDKAEDKYWWHWDADTKTYWLQILFKNEWAGTHDSMPSSQAQHYHGGMMPQSGSQDYPPQQRLAYGQSMPVR